MGLARGRDISSPKMAVPNADPGRAGHSTARRRIAKRVGVAEANVRSIAKLVEVAHATASRITKRVGWPKSTARSTAKLVEVT